MATAFMNPFAEQETYNQSPELNTSAVPAYLLAADNHNIGNLRGGSWFDPTTWGDKFAGAGKMISTGILSGANSFYNTGAQIGNWLGAEAEQRDTKDWISSIDNDLGVYYGENQGAADLVGFIASSLIPGIGGIKILNAGQVALKAASTSGTLGANLSRATGLLVPQSANYVAAAAKEITQSAASFSFLNQNVLKGLAAGVQQNFLEAAAFEVAVQATLFKSPILDQQDGWDIVKNVTLGASLGGVIGGAFSGAGFYGKVKKAVVGIEKEVAPFGSRVTIADGTSASDRYILMAEDADAAILPNPNSPTYELELSRYNDKLRRIENDKRTTIHSMIRGKDSELGNLVADSLYGIKTPQILNNLQGADEFARLSELTAFEKLQAKNIREGKPPNLSLQTQYVKLTGEGAGVVSDTAPLVKNLADTLVPKSGQSTKDAVLGEVRTFGHKPNQLWSALEIKGANANLVAESRYIWATDVLKEIKDGTKIHQYDFPVLERALVDKQLNIVLADSAGGTLQKGFNSVDELQAYLIEAKQSVANELLLKRVLEGDVAVEAGTVAIAKIVNTKLSRLEGTVGKDTEDFFAWQNGSKEYLAELNSKGLKTPATPDADVRFLPSYAKISKQAADLTDIDGNIIDGMTYIKSQQKLLDTAMDNVLATHLGEFDALAPKIADSALLTANRFGAGSGLVSFANGSYGTIESALQLSGALTRSVKQKFRDTTSDLFTSPLVRLGEKQEAAIEFATLNQKITRSAQNWVRYTDEAGDGAEYMVTQSALRKHGEDGILDFDSLSADVPDELISLKNPEVVATVDAMIARAGSRTTAYKNLRSAQGLEDAKDVSVYRPIRPSPTEFPFFAFVKDESVVGQGHTTMIHAASEAKLQDLAKKVPSQYKVYFKKDTEDFFKARDEYEYSRTLNESYIDSELKSAGVASEFFTQTDPRKIVDGILKQHLREDDVLATELMRAKNQRAFDWLEDQASTYTKLESSRYGSYLAQVEKSGQNPYLSYIKTALDVNRASEHQLLFGFNKFLDEGVSRAVGRISDAWNEWKNPLDDVAVTKINQALSANGMNTGYYDAATILLANHTAPRGELSKFVRGANAILSRLTLGLDPLNAVNNLIGANVLRTTELTQILRAIEKGDTELAGALGNISRVKLPGVDDTIFSAPKLVAAAIRNYTKDDGTLLAKYQTLGTVKDATAQFKSILDDFTLVGTESVSELQSRLTGAFAKARTLSETGEKFTGNKHAEELNRFISSNVMDQLTSLAVKKGLLSEVEAGAYINTFVNRVEGNTLASQRPLMFQGPIGQAVGLFQSYQFNLIQQMFRYVAEGSAKDSAMLLGLQGTFYGLQGLPAFQFINQHVVGSLSGNPKHVDLYDATYGVAGREVGDWLLYGLPSNILRANLYSRGDINPRQVTIIPTTIPDIPFVGAFGKFLGSLKETTGKIATGGNVWESVLQGLEHNGLSRPLAGFAQTLQFTGEGGKPYSTTTKGSILFSNDLFSVATAVRMAGGRPLDEAIINDGVFRIQSYKQLDRDKMKVLGEVIKTSLISGNRPEEDQMAAFVKRYAASGGKQAQFNSYMMEQYKTANTTRSQEILSNLQNPFAQKMQLLMGGSEPE